MCVFEEYLAPLQAEHVRARMRRVRAILLEEAPEATESKAYGMPAYKLGGKPLLYLAAYPRHIGFYPTSEGILAIKDQLTGYQHSKGAVRIPHDTPLPEELIRSWIRRRLQQVLSSP